MNSNYSEEDGRSAALRPVRRSGHVAVAVGNLVVVWGGYTEMDDDEEEELIEERYLPAQEIWIYHTDIQRWLFQRTTGEAPSGLSGSSAVLIGRQIYVTCGCGPLGGTSGVYRLDTLDWTWTWLRVERDEEKPSTRDKIAAWEHDDRLYIFGGYGLPIYWFLHDNGDYFEDPETATQAVSRGWNNQLLFFDISTRTWNNPECLGDVPSPRAAHAIAKFEDTVYLFGGRHNNTRLNDLYQLQLESLTWIRLTTVGECPVPRTWHSFTAASARHIFLFGGYSQQPPEIRTGEPLGDAWLLDIVDLRWKQYTGFTDQARLWHAAALTADKDIVLFGGCTSNIFSTDEVQRHSNSLLTFRLSPKSLVRLSLDATFQYRRVLSAQWRYLPKQLSHILNDRLNRLSNVKLHID